jgi:hypothetical protein
MYAKDTKEMKEIENRKGIKRKKKKKGKEKWTERPDRPSTDLSHGPPEPTPNRYTPPLSLFHWQVEPPLTGGTALSGRHQPLPVTPAGNRRRN